MRDDATRELPALWIRAATDGASEPGARELGAREIGLRARPKMTAEADEEALDARRRGPYELLEPLGSGAMGRVYRARHVLLGRLVAIKVMRPELAVEDAQVERFVAEARAANLIQHPHVIEVMDIRVARDVQHTPWLVMELLEGMDVATLVQHERAPLTRVLQIMRQVCEALDAIHAAGVVHRDVKPENIFITQRDGRDFVKLIDFGVARLGDSTVAVAPRGVGELVGTPHYMAPEQADDLELDHRADLYAVGAVLFELITGAAPLDADDLPTLLSLVRLSTPPPVSSLVELPVAARAEIDALIARCLEKRPCDRPSSAREVLEALDRISACSSLGTTCTLRSPLVGPLGTSDALVLEPVRVRGRTVSRWIGAVAAAVTLCVAAPVPLSEPALANDASLAEEVPTTLAVPAQPLQQEMALALASVPPPVPVPAVQEGLATPIVVAVASNDDERPARVERRRVRARVPVPGKLESAPLQPILIVTPLSEPASPEGEPRPLQ